MSNLASIKALPGYVLIEPQDETEEIKGSTASFKIADAVKDAESQRIGKILSIGDEQTTVYGAKLVCPPQVKIGSIVAHKQYGYDRFKYKNREIKFVSFIDLVGVINE